MNYGELKTAIANRLSRSNLTAIIPDFITFGESSIYYGLDDPEIRIPALRIRSMLATETASLATLPTDFLEAHRFTVPDTYGPRHLSFITPEEFAQLDTSTNYPRYFTYQDGGISVEGGTPASFTFGYYKKFDALATDSDTNWLLTNNPRVYLYAALIEAYQHVKDDARALTAARQFGAAVNGMMVSDKAETHSGAVLLIPTGRT